MLVRRQETLPDRAPSATGPAPRASASRATRPAADEWVDVCALCTDAANEHGWIKEGTPTTPIVDGRAARRRRRFGGPRDALRAAASRARAGRLGARPAPALARGAGCWSRPPRSSTRAPTAGRSPGSPRASARRASSMIPLSGTNAEIVITIAWEISWYQYRVISESSQPVRLDERGQDSRRGRRALPGLERAASTRHSRLRPDIPRF